MGGGVIAGIVVALLALIGLPVGAVLLILKLSKRNPGGFISKYKIALCVVSVICILAFFVFISSGNEKQPEESGSLAVSYYLTDDEKDELEEKIEDYLEELDLFIDNSMDVAVFSGCAKNKEKLRKPIDNMP